MMIVLTGKMRHGKTLIMTVFAKISEYFDERKIHSNYEIKLPNYIPLDLKKLFNNQINDAIIYLDEAYTYLESRVSTSDMNKAMSYILFQSGKRNLDMILSAQDFSTIDVRFRKQTDYQIKCKRVRNSEFNGFEYKIFINSMNPKTLEREFRYIKSLKLSFNEAKKYFPLYNTFEVITPYQQQKISLEILKNTNPKDYDKEIIKVASMIKPNLSRITHDSVSKALRHYGIPTFIEKEVYIELKGAEFFQEVD